MVLFLIVGLNMEQDRNSNNILEIKDISLASYLFAIGGVKLIGKRRLSSNEVLFQFQPKSKAQDLISDYWNLKAPLIQPKLLFGALRDLKDMIFSS